MEKELLYKPEIILQRIVGLKKKRKARTRQIKHAYIDMKINLVKISK